MVSPDEPLFLEKMNLTESVAKNFRIVSLSAIPVDVSHEELSEVNNEAAASRIRPVEFLKWSGSQRCGVEFACNRPLFILRTALSEIRTIYPSEAKSLSPIKAI
jgi:hypothetical protein